MQERIAMERKIRNSAKALIIKDGKMLAIKLRDSDGEWFIMPYGRPRSGRIIITSCLP